MAPLIQDSTSDSRMDGLEAFLQSYVGPRLENFGASEDDVQSLAMPKPLQRFYRFAGRWPGQNPHPPYANRFCMQDTLAGIVANEYAPALRLMDDRLVFVWENQGVWVASTEPQGIDPPVWISEDCSHRDERRVWRQLENPLTHFLVSFILQELLFGSQLLGAAPKAFEKFETTGLGIQPVWINGEYAWDIDRPSYFVVDHRFLIRRAPEDADGDDWYGCKNASDMELLSWLDLSLL